MGQGDNVVKMPLVHKMRGDGHTVGRSRYMVERFVPARGYERRRRKR